MAHASQSAATSEIGHEFDSRKWRFNKCPDLYLYFYSATSNNMKTGSTKEV